MSPVSPVSPVSGLAENLSIFLAKSGYQSMMDPGQDGQDGGGQDSLGEIFSGEPLASSFNETWTRCTRITRDH